MKKYSVVVYLFLMLIIVVVAEFINLCCHLLFGKKPNQKVSAMSIIINSFLLTVLMFAAGAFITKALGWDKEED